MRAAELYPIPIGHTIIVTVIINSLSLSDYFVYLFLFESYMYTTFATKWTLSTPSLYRQEQHYKRH
jgi:hypothetical protein